MKVLYVVSIAGSGEGEDQLMGTSDQKYQGLQVGYPLFPKYPPLGPPLSKSLPIMQASSNIKYVKLLLLNKTEIFTN